MAAVWVGTLVTFAVFLFTGQFRVFDKVLWDFNVQYAERLPKFLQKDPDLVPEIPKELAERLGTSLRAVERKLALIRRLWREEVVPQEEPIPARSFRREGQVNQ